MDSGGIIMAYRRHETPSKLTVGFAAPAGLVPPAWEEVCSRMGAAPYEHIAEEANAEWKPPERSELPFALRARAIRRMPSPFGLGILPGVLPADDEPAAEAAIQIAECRLESGGPPILRDPFYEYYYATFESLLPSQLDKDALLFHLPTSFIALATHRYSAPRAHYDWDVRGGTVLPPGGVGKVSAMLVNATPASTVPLPRIGDLVTVRGQTICLLPLTWSRVDIEIEYSEAVPVCFTFLDMASRYLLTEDPQISSNDRIVIGRS